MRFALCFLVACAGPASRAVVRPLSEHTLPARAFPTTSIYHVNLADEVDETGPFRRVEIPELWIVKPEQPVADWPWFWQQMRTHGFTGFDFSAVDVVDWGSIPADIHALRVTGREDLDDVEALLRRSPWLTWLDLANTKASDRTCALIAELPRLQRISLAETEISDICVARLALHRQLERLDLQKTLVTDAGVIKLTSLPLLASLSLAHTRVSDASVAPLLDHFAFRALNLAETGASHRSQQRLAKTTSFERLDLSKTQVSAKVVRSLLRHPYLQWLSLAGVAVGDSDVAALTALRRIEVLDVSESAITKLDPLAQLERLRLLSFSGTVVYQLEPIAGLRGLSYLDASDTLVDDNAIQSLRGLPLQTLDLTGTRITSLAPLTPLKRLRELHLGKTQITRVDALAEFPFLRVLSLKGTKLESLAPVEGLSGLERLSLAGAQFSALSLRKLTHLVLLNLNDTAVSSAELDALSSDALLVLQLARTKVDAAALSRTLPRLQTLQTLDLAGLPIDEAAVTGVSLPRLRVLNLSHTQVHDLSRLTLPRLERLYLMGVELTKDGLPDRKRLPRLVGP
jgi:internalin A